MQEGMLGEKGKNDIYLTRSLDTWDVRARGSSARVFEGIIYNHNGHRRSIAVKFMRPDEIEYATPMFLEEVKILTTLRDIPGVMRMLELGYIQFDDPTRIPTDLRDSDGRTLSGKVHRYTPDETTQFLNDFSQRMQDDWLPYLGLRRSHYQDNLLLLCDENYTRGKLLPVAEGLQVAIQACEVLEQAHAHNIVYRDHKIIHYYWNRNRKTITLIDWNVGRLFPDGVSEAAIRHDLGLFAVSALYYIFTGRKHSHAPKIGPTRPDELEDTPDTFPPHWRYGDRKRLKRDLRATLENALQGRYQTAEALKQDLQRFAEGGV